MNLLHQCRAEFSGKTLCIFQHFVTRTSPEFFSLYFCSLCTSFMFLEHFCSSSTDTSSYLIGQIYATNEKLLSHSTKAALHTTDVAFLLHLPPLQWQNGTRHACVFEAFAVFSLNKNYCLDTSRTVILFSSRYLLSAKSICPTCKQALFTTNVPIMVLMRANPFSRDIGRGGVGPKNRDLLSPEMAKSKASAIWAQKSRRSFTK